MKETRIMNLLLFILVVTFCYTTGTADQCKPSAFPREPQSGCCGTTEPEKTNLTHPFRTLGQYPWIGLVEYQKENETELVYRCNAFLISSRYALSAAECFTKDAADVGKPVKVLLGEYNRSYNKDCIIALGGKINCSDDPISIPIEKTIVHPNFNNNGNKQNDIALIRLANMAPFTDFISPVCLPVSDVTLNPPESLHLIAVGWRNINLTGLFDTSEHNLVFVFDALYVQSNTCKSSYEPFNTTVGNDQFCARSENMTADIIDTGLPLIYTNGNYSEVVGITSYPGEAGVPDVYTKVFDYKTWILENIKEYVKNRFREHNKSNGGLDWEDIGGSLYCNNGALSIVIEKIITHPNFKNDGSRQRNIALIRLAKMVPLSDFISPICLPTSDVTLDPPNHSFFKVAGWGPINSTTTSTNVLHHVNVPFVNFDTCKSTYAAINITLENGQLCAGGQGTDPCKEDAGGSLMYIKGHITEDAGIVSFGPVPCGKPGVPGVFTKVFAYDAWIRKTMEQ